MTVHEERRTKRLTFFRRKDARPLEEDGMMSAPHINPAVYQELDFSAIAAGSQVDVLFRGEGPSGFSLVHVKFGPGYRLPRHSHSADCLYFVLSGEAIMGNRVFYPGDGFFVPCDAPYAYEAGPQGVEVLEFRAATSFDMKILDQTVERWRPIIDAAVANHDRWVATGADA